MIVGVLGLFVAVAIALPVARRVARRVVAVAEVAKRIADGDLDVPAIGGGARDEIGETARAVDTMVSRLRELIAREAERAASERARLQAMVDERTAQLAERNRAMRLVLEHVNQGLLTISRDGVIHGEQSTAAATLLGDVAEGANLADLVRAIDARGGDAFAMAFSQLVDDILPIEVLVDQVPKQIVSKDRELAVACTAIRGADGAVARLLVTLTDVTAEREHERARAADEEQIVLFRALSTDRHGCKRFISDSAQHIATIEQSQDLAAIKAALHTLKGNTALVGLAVWSARCHAAEDASLTAASCRSRPAHRWPARGSRPRHASSR